MESVTARLWRILAVLLFAATAFFPVVGCQDAGQPGWPFAGPEPDAGPAQVQADWSFLRWLGDPGGEPQFTLLGAFGFDESFPYYLAPLWLAGLLLAGTGRPLLRRITGWAMVVLSAALVAYVFALFGGTVLKDYCVDGRLIRAGSLVLSPVERGAAALVAGAVLFARRPGRRLLEPEAAVSALALLCVVHGIGMVARSSQEWAEDGRPAWAILRALPVKYLPAYWIGLGALLAAAIPGYLRLPPGGPGRTS